MVTELPKQARETIRQLRNQHSQIPVPVVAIAQELGARIFETTDFSSRYSGSIKKEGGSYCIYLNANDDPARKRFTIAHEIGHLVLHKEYLESGKEDLTEIKQPVELNRPSRPLDELDEEKRREVEANKFAGELLMPQKEFKKAFEESQSIEAVAEIFNVSTPAATVRAKELLGLTII